MSHALQRHSVRTADGVEIILHRVPGRALVSGPPVLLVAGTFSSHHFWIGDRGQGFALGLASAGFDSWLVDLRGHGASGRPSSWTMDDWILRDAPAAVEKVLEVTGASRLLWVGHSGGGVVGAAVAGSGGQTAGRLAGIVLLGAPGPTLNWWRRGIVAGVLFGAWLLGTLHLPGRVVRLGPEHEPAALVRHWMRWNLTGRWMAATGEDFLAGLADVRLPVLAVAGAGDHLLAPPEAVRDLLNRFGSSDRAFIEAGVESGFSMDFDHPGLMMGQSSRLEIWPRVIEWLHQHRDIPNDPKIGTPESE